MKTYLSFFLLFIFSISYSQVKYNDKIIVAPQIQKIYDEGEKCLKIPSKDCEHLYREAIEYGIQNEVSYMDYLYFQLGYYFDVRSKYDSSLYYTEKAFKITNKNDPNSAYNLILNSLGSNYFRSGDYDKATHYMIMTVKSLEQHGKPLHLVYAYNNLGTVMGVNENYEEAVKYYKKGYKILEEIKDTVIIPNLASNTAIYLKKQNKFQEARNWAKKAVELGEKYNNPSAYSYGNYILGTTEKDINKSLYFIKNAVDKSREFDLKDVLGDALDIYSMKLSEKGLHAEAKKSIQEAIRIHEASSYTTGLLSAYSNAAQIYFNAGEFKTSTEFFIKYNDLYKENIPAENKKTINELNTKYETEKKEKQIAEQDLKIQKQRANLLYAILGGALLVSILGGIFLYNRKAQKLKLKQVQQEKENAILNSFIQGEERERNRISYELHDGVAAMIGAAKMNLETIPHLPPEMQTEQLSKVKEILENTHADVRHIAHNLLPTVLEKEGIIKATQQFVSEINQTQLIQVSVVDNQSKADELSKQLQLMLFRIIQELINNTIKHSQAHNAVINFSRHQNELQIEVSDDGIGYDGDVNSGNQGLYSISQRLKSIGGNFKFIKKNDRGMKAIAEINI